MTQENWSEVDLSTWGAIEVKLSDFWDARDRLDPSVDAEVFPEAFEAGWKRI